MKYVRLAGIIGISACLISCIADISLLYSPNGGYLDGTYEFLKGISHTRLLVGHFLGIFMIPLNLLGLWVVYQGLKPAGEKIALSALLIGIFLGFPGVAYHATVSFLAETMNNPNADFPAAFKFGVALAEPLGGAFALGFFVISGIFVVVVLKGNTRFKKTAVFFNPLAVYFVLFLLYLAVPVVGNVIIPAGFNFSLAVFFAACLYYGDFGELKKQEV